MNVGFLGQGGAHSPITKDNASVTNPGAGTIFHLTMSIGSNPNRILIINCVAEQIPGTPSAVSTVKIGSTNFTHISACDIDSGGTYHVRSEVWILINPPTGSQTIDVTFAGAVSEGAVGGLSLYNVDQVTGVQNGTSAGGANGATVAVSVTPTVTGSWIFAGGIFRSPNTITFSDTQDWNDNTNLVMCGQHKASPTINSANSLSFSTNNTVEWAFSGIEVLRA